MPKPIFHYTNYKIFLRDWIAEQPHTGRGQRQKIAKLLRISSVSVSHILSGPRHLTKEQALEVAEFLALPEIEAEFLFLLVDFERAGTAKLKRKLGDEIARKAEKAQVLKARVPRDLELDAAAQAFFYSGWFYSAIRMLTSIEGYHSAGEIASRLSLPPAQVREALAFLVRYGLCVEENSKFRIGPKKTHVGADSPLVVRHHTNWRLKSIENMGRKDAEKEELFYTGPMTLSHTAVLEIRKELVNLVERVVKTVGPSKSEEFMCLNIDWFKVRR